jgi:hypothetical protein
LWNAFVCFRNARGYIYVVVCDLGWRVFCPLVVEMRREKAVLDVKG